MKKAMILAFLVLFIAAIVYGQDKLEAPAWNVGDQWVLSDDFIITVTNADQDSFTVMYQTVREI